MVGLFLQIDLILTMVLVGVLIQMQDIYGQKEQVVNLQHVMQKI